MNKDSSSVLGKTEQVGVGIFRAPVLVGKVIGRVRELLKNPNRGEGGGGGRKGGGGGGRGGGGG